MFDFFKSKKQIEIPHNDKIIEPDDPSELNKFDIRTDPILDDMKKQFDYTLFESARDDQGNYFGTEFDIQTTVTRLKSMYVKEPWCYIAADKIARTSSTVPLVVKNTKDKEINEAHPANIIVNGGTAFQDSVSKKWVSFLDLVLGGNGYAITDKAYTYSLIVPTEMITLEAKGTDNFDEIIKTGPVDYANIFGYGAKNNAMKVPYQQLIHFKLPNPYNPFYGLSPFAAASRPALLDRYKNEFEMAFYHRGATHSGVIENQNDISKEKMRRLVSTFEQMYTGKRNWWRPLFLPKGAIWKSSTLTMAEMQHLEGLRENRLTLLAVLGIPPSQVGIVQDVNRSTSEIQERTFWQNTIIPFLTFYASGWNNSYLFKYVYKNEVYVEPDFTGISALEGSLISKGETANSIKEFYTVNEIRVKVFGDKPLPEGDDRGNMFAKEITPDLFGSSNPSDETAKVVPGQAEPPALSEPESQTTEKIISSEKEFLTAAMIGIEKTLAAKFYGYVIDYENILLNQTIDCLNEGRNLNTYLMINENKRLDSFIETGMPTLLDAMDKGYQMTLISTKKATAIAAKARIGYEFTDEDVQALEAIKQRTESGKRKLLIDRAIHRFKGWDRTYTEEVMKMVEKGIKDGKTTAQIANEIKISMEKRGPGEAYRDQAFTIARTETLVAVSEGIKWSNESLNAVFTEVNKLWIHTGDWPKNKDARKDHYDFQRLGHKPSAYVYVSEETGHKMVYPRDVNLNATGEDIINCRCSMSNIIPKTSISRAKSINFHKENQNGNTNNRQGRGC